MREAVVVESLRTGLAKSFRGSFNATRSDDLAAYCVQGQNVARIAAMLAGLPITTAGTTVNRFCSSGLQSIAMAAHEIIHEGAEAVMAGGVESITMLSNSRREPNP